MHESPDMIKRTQKFTTGNKTKSEKIIGQTTLLVSNDQRLRKHIDIELQHQHIVPVSVRLTRTVSISVVVLQKQIECKEHIPV